MPWDMIGHHWAVGLLRRNLAHGRTRQAYLICGPDGVGKRTLALQLAAALNCEEPPEPGDSCGHCRPCRLIAAGTYPDLHQLEADRLGGVLKVEQVRQLQRQLALAPFEGRWRLALLLRFHEANPSAANALLKTLEEPASQVVLLLTARTPEAVLPTIVSRCELISLRTLTPAEVAEGLIGRGVDPVQAGLAANLAGGRPGRAIRLSTDERALSRRAQIVSDLLALLEGQLGERFRYVEKMTRGGESGERREKSLEVLETWLALWREAMHRSFGASPAIGGPAGDGLVEKIARCLGPEQIVSAVEATQRTLEDVSKNANLRLAFEALMLEMPVLNRG